MGRSGGVGTLAAIERICDSGLGAQALLEEVVARIVPTLGAEAFFAGATDPETGLCMGAGVVDGMASSICAPFWDHEFFVPDYNKFADLTPARPAADLHEATGGRVQRSARWRAFHGISDLDAELRVAFHDGGRTWGVLQLNRHSGARPFAPEHRELLERVAPMIGRGLRTAMVAEPAEHGVGRGPGILILDERGTVVSCTSEAEAWLAELREGDWCGGASGLPVPIEVFALSLTAGDPAQPAAARQARLRTRSGMWLMAHASPLGAGGQVAMVIEPAKASQVAPVIVEAYGLTAREVDVTRLVARGLKTDEIGAELYLSPHTVRDHLKAVFEKVGVSSRGELVSQLFAEHYHGSLASCAEDGGARVSARLGRPTENARPLRDCDRIADFT
ncbi:LuxR C-terminal-related transcriptional regulator [Patulibacter defluvii]|uniref:LuxR C-terminal-related transcriptional regulator n=1 Tax=Patulibacter defluvii TaxID=3095358 RepID=UPI002A7639D2|nr:LuxR C-terminal-related transcriptional regulator [Patulibacter sp. DM4]